MIKLTDEISSILIDENSIIAIVPTSNHFGSRKTCVHLSGGSKLIVNETPEVIISILNDTTPEKVIDWEQRRYEIAKDITAAIYTRPNVKGTLLNYNQIVAAADGLIRELKKGTEQ